MTETNSRTNSSLAGYRGRVSGSNGSDGSDGNDSDDMLWFATEADLAASAEAVAYALRAFIAGDSHPTLEQGGEREEVQVLNVEVSADHHETGGGHKTVSALLRRRPPDVS